MRSFGFAFAGLAYLVRTQSNVWVHLSAAFLVMLAALLLRVPTLELTVLVLAIGLVLATEAFNTAVEAVVDLASPESHPLARLAKDVSAAGVLLAAACAAAVGLIVLLPRLIAWVFAAV